ncbi:ABC transporter ATP-binding protein [Persicobacter diffluens]|uniref:Multidrug ABC transporter ATP-binding protein n=1 Tax=Persicobacter diffluens TaxID=981 RepID=A0AAN4W0W5_9BACT|nr:multidrug ABC transporter ATP-binding protein [Persicobacter diffluens]
MPKLQIENLTKVYPNGVKALDNVTLEIENGMFGLLGPNGAGKSSLMRTLATLQDADSGSAKLDDINIFEQPQKLKQVLGYLPQEFGVYPRVTAQELLMHIAVFKGIGHKKERKELVDYLLNKVNLYEHKDKYVKGFSGGMKQRVGIAQALIGAPKLLIVDEPTAGLDPGERNRFHNLLADVGEEVIVILSTHIVEDVRELCTKMAIMNKGRIVFDGAPEEALGKWEGQVWQKQIDRKELEAYESQYQLISHKMVAGKPLVHVLSEVNPGAGFEAIPASLEDAFFAELLEQDVAL